MSNLSKLRTALIGLGDGAKHIVLPGLSTLPTIDLVAACDTNPPTAAAFQQQYPAIPVYTDVNALFDAHTIDLVTIATPPMTHYAMAKLALEKNCHLFCEKPFMPSLVQADEIIALAEQRQRHILVNNQYYQMPIYADIKSFITQGKTGRVYQVTTAQYMHVPSDHESGWKAALQPRRVLFEFGTHAIDLACRFFDAYPTHVTSFIARVAADEDTDNCITTRLDFPDARVATLHFNRMSHAPLQYFELQADAEKMRLKASLGGVAKLEVKKIAEKPFPQVAFSFTRGGELWQEIHGVAKKIQQQPTSAYSDAATEHLSAFVNAILQGQHPPTTIQHARHILNIMLSAYESAEAGGTRIAL